MSNKFLDAMEDKVNYTATENGATAKHTTKDNLLDFFAQVGALRNRNKEDIIRLFDKALTEDDLLAVKTLFYARNVRGGLGERRIFRVILKYLTQVKPEVVLKNLEHIPHYGRWDDLYALFDTRLEGYAANFMKAQFFKDINSEKPSLLAKWLKSENASSDETKRLARKTRKHFEMTARGYRKTLSKLRKKIGVVERKMSNNDWEDIDYSSVPSRAQMIYNNAFERHDPEGYHEYIENVKSGEDKINASTLYPYDLVRKVIGVGWGHSVSESERNVLNEQWKALPDYINDKNENSICVVDTSGSMMSSDGLPLHIALSLGLYMAERNSGPFKDRFITFSASPDLVKVEGSDFVQKIKNMRRAHWDMNTDIEAVFNLILDTAIENHLHQDEIPQKLYIISDMEFDQCTGRGYGFNSQNKVTKTLFEKLKESFKHYGYKMPDLVFWNVEARNEVFQFDKDERGFQLVSGASPVVFEHTMKGEFVSAYDLMLDVITDEQYDRITV